MNTNKNAAFKRLIQTLPIFLMIGLVFLGCKWLSAKEQPAAPGIKNKIETPMPSLPTLNDYTESWKIIDSLEREGLFESALKEVEKVYARAKQDNNGPQTLKSLIYKGKYAIYLEEEGFVSAIYQFEAEIKSARQPDKSILQSGLAQLYNAYLQNQGYSLANRTPAPGLEGGDIKTWSAAQLERKILTLYHQSIEAEASLRAVPIEVYKEILFPGEYDTLSTPLRNNLFDFLAFRALSHFMDERSYLSEPVYAFVLNQPEAFAPAESFIKAPFTNRDSSAGKWLSIKLFQRILAGAQNDRSNFLDADLQRLRFAYNNSVLTNKFELYEKSLLLLQERYPKSVEESEILLALGALHRDDPSDKASRKKAVAYFEQIVQLYPNSYAALHAVNYLDHLKKHFFEVQAEGNILPDESSLIALHYKNIRKLYGRVFPIPASDNSWDDMTEEARLEKIKGFQAIANPSWELAEQGDFLDHNTEIAVDPLPVGKYVVLFSENAAFDPKESSVKWLFINVTNIAASVIQGAQEGHLLVMHRKTGKPLPGIQCKLYDLNYNPESGRYDKRFLETRLSDANGLVNFQLTQRRNVQLELVSGKESLEINDIYHYYPQQPRERTSIQFFTDRKIYRPGQTIYFKAVVYKRDPQGRPAILPNEKLSFRLLDANGQESQRIEGRTNEFGTVNGAFTAPLGGLTGQMRIIADKIAGGAYFNVEEYKRPKFEVVLNPVIGSFRLKESIDVPCEARAFAGSQVSGAAVRYRVVRNARFPYFQGGWYRRMMPWINTPPAEIAQGTLVTDAAGRFTVNFKAIPDESIPQQQNPVFDYEIFVDVTDINGETRSNSRIVSVGYTALNLQLGIEDNISTETLKSVNISASNLGGQALAAQGTIGLYPLNEPDKLFRKRLWEKPDVWTMSESDFKKRFPAYTWKNEDDPDNWSGPDVEYTYSFNTETQKTIDLMKPGLQPGIYRLLIKTRDAFGEAVEIKRYVRIWDAQKLSTRFHEPLAFLDKLSYEPGEKANLLLGARTPELYSFVALENDGKLDKLQWIRAENAHSQSFTTTEDDRGGRHGIWLCVYNNREYSVAFTINVPWSNKDLNIRYESFRDKLLPGQQETWKMTISGPKKEKVAAELCATLYDASLDQFLPNYWNRIGYPARIARLSANFRWSFGNAENGMYDAIYQDNYRYIGSRQYKSLNWFDMPMGYRGRFGAPGMLYESNVVEMRSGGNPMKKAMPAMAPASALEADNMAMEAESSPEEHETSPAAAAPAYRSNLKETVFFFPEIRTDADGNVVLSFTMNEALTRWKLLLYAHTKDLQELTAQKEIITQKDLMLLANAPRFLRAGDRFQFAAKMTNLSQQTVSGNARIELLDAVTLKPLNQSFGLPANTSISFKADAGQSSPLHWDLQIPDDFTGAVTWRAFAQAGAFSDGEEGMLPVVSNRMLVTETLPMTLRSGQERSFQFENLKKASESLRTERYTIEFTSNPAWYVVQSLPYLMEYPHECSEQLFSRFYANALAAGVTKKMPEIRRVYEQWKNQGANGPLASNLSKNQELKYALLSETPWVLDAQSETQQKQNIALLFDLNRMADEQARALSMLAQRQSPNGGWSWFGGGPENWYITQYIVQGFGHLDRLGAYSAGQQGASADMIDKALGFCDREVEKYYNELAQRVKEGKTKWEDDHLESIIIQYLYARSFFPNEKVGKVQAYFLEQAQQFWTSKGLYQQGLIALALQRNGRKEAALRVVNSLRERALMKDELGMFWAYDRGYFWYQMPIETQALMVEVFDEVAADQKAVEELRIWLLKNKQTNRWESTKATAEAAYALLLHGENWLSNTQTVQVQVGGKAIQPDEVEPGTGYFKEQWGGNEVKSSWNTISVKNPNNHLVWGAAYWQYMEDLDKITSFQKTPLSIVKQLYREEYSPEGPILKAISANDPLKVGDRIKVRIEIRADRPMEFIHLKDMRAAGFEPLNVLSEFRRQGGLGYYESTRDLATHFFIDYLPKGTFVFEYSMVAAQRGNMSNGITTIQCMYAPEFTSHSQGISVEVK